MRKAYRCRPDDFDRYILDGAITSKKELLAREYEYLNLIPMQELGVNYYNLHNTKINTLRAKSSGKLHFQQPGKAAEMGRKAAGSGPRKVVALGIAGTQTKSTCPHCGVTGQTRAIKRWHFANCPVVGGVRKNTGTWNKGLTKDDHPKIAAIGQKNRERLIGSRWSDAQRKSRAA